MNNKLARAKPAGPKERKESREYDWHRLATIMNVNYKPRQVDIWWARKFLKRIIADPIVQKGKLTLDESPGAWMFLKMLDAKYPEIDYRRLERQEAKKAKPKKYKKASNILIAQSTLRGLRKKLKELKPKLGYWEPRYAKMGISNPKWKEIRDKVMELRAEQDRLKKRIADVKKVLPIIKRTSK
jgi:hypothetical protein